MNTNSCFVRLEIINPQETDIIRGNHRNITAKRELNRALNAGSVIFPAGPLYFQIVAIRKDLQPFSQQGSGEVRLAHEDCLPYVTLTSAGQGDQSFGGAPQPGMPYPWHAAGLPLGIAAGDQPGEMKVTSTILAQEDQVAADTTCLIEDPDFTPNDRFNTRLLTGPVELDYGIKVTQLRKRQGRHSHSYRLPDQIRDPDHAIHERVLAMEMQMYK